MDLIKEIYKRAGEDLQIIAFPEVNEEKILQAARESLDNRLCIPMLVGNMKEIEDSSKRFSVSLEGMKIFDCENEEKLDNLFQEYAKINTEMSLKSMKRKSKDSMYIAMMLEAIDVADITFAGISHTTGEVIWAAQMIIGMHNGISTASSIGIAEIPGYQGSEGNLLVVGDSAVCANPTAEDLAGIAVSACDSVKAILNWEPRCALLSFSTTGSAEDELVNKVVKAVGIAQEMHSDYLIDGEFQLDAAISPQVAEKKVTRPSEVAGRANILIWPDLNTGNIGVKLLQQFGHADVYGPILQGFKKVVCDCSRGAPLSELLGNIAISAVRSQGLKKSK